MGGKTLPPLELECSGCAHRWPTRAAAGSSIRCPECRRVRRVPAERPGQGTAARTVAAGGDDSLTARWAAEAPAALGWRDTPTAPAAETCGTCGAPLAWHSARTVLVCLVCGTLATSPGAWTRAAEHAAALDRRQARGRATVADVDPAAEARARVARVNLHRARERLTRGVHNMLANVVVAARAYEIDDIADDLGSVLRAYLTEVNAATDISTLAAILGELKQIAADAAYRECRELAEQARAAGEDDDDQGDDDQGDDEDSDSGYPARRAAEAGRQVRGYVAPDPSQHKYLTPREIEWNKRMAAWTPDRARGDARAAALRQGLPA